VALISNTMCCFNLCKLHDFFTNISINCNLHHSVVYHYVVKLTSQTQHRCAPDHLSWQPALYLFDQFIFTLLHTIAPWVNIWVLSPVAMVDERTPTAITCLLILWSKISTCFYFYSSIFIWFEDASWFNKD